MVKSMSVAIFHPRWMAIYSAALERKAQVNRKKRLLDGEGEAKMTMLACSKSPPGHARWSLR